MWSSVVSAKGHRGQWVCAREDMSAKAAEAASGAGQAGVHTWEGHEHVTVLGGHRLHPRLVGHQVAAGLQEPLPEQFICGAARQVGLRSGLSGD